MIQTFKRPMGRKLISLISSAFLLLLISLCLLPSVVSAHAVLLRSEPPADTVLQQSPTKVVAFFEETIEPRFSSLKVLDTQGNQVDNHDSHVNPTDPLSMSVSLPLLQDGIYTVSWSAVSAVDGHALNGAFLFSVRVPLNGSIAIVSQQSPVQTVGGSILKWLVLLCLLGIVGSFTFEILIWRPVLAVKTVTASQEQLAKIVSFRSAKLRWLMIVTFLIASLGQLVVQAMAVLNLPLGQAIAHLDFGAGSPIILIVTGTDWGHLWLWRVILVIDMAIFLWLFPGLPNSETKGGIRNALYKIRFLVPLLFGCGALLTLSLVSHGAAVTGVRAGAVFSDYIHLLAAAFWIGGVFFFALMLSVLKKHLSPEENRATFAALLPRFSILAVMSVGTLAISGLYSTWVNVGSVSHIATSYGLILSAKVGLFVLLLCLGALNMLLVSKLLTKDARGVTWLNRFVRTEVTIGILVLLSAAVLTNIQTARQTVQSSATTLHGTSQGVAVDVQVAPGRVGSNTVTMTLTDINTHAPVNDGSLVSLQIKYLNQDLGTKTIYPLQDSSGNYVAQNVDFGVVGPWELDVAAVRRYGFDVVSTLNLAITNGSASGVADVPSAQLGSRLWGAELALLGLFYPSVFIFFRRTRDDVISVVIGIGVMAILCGCLLIIWA